MTLPIKQYNINPQQWSALQKGLEEFHSKKTSKNGEILSQFQLNVDGKSQTVVIRLSLGDNPTADQINELATDLLKEAIRSRLGTKTKEIRMRTTANELEVTKYYDQAFLEQNKPNHEQKYTKVQISTGEVFSKTKKYKTNEYKSKFQLDASISSNKKGTISSDEDTGDIEIATIDRRRPVPDSGSRPVSRSVSESTSVANNSPVLDSSRRQVSRSVSDPTPVANKPTVADTRPLAKTQSITKPGGIVNGGASCYLASALQVIQSIPEYEFCFDPIVNPLQLRKDSKGNVVELQESLQQRQLIQSKGFAILKEIRRGNTVSAETINDFRNACFAHKYDGTTSTIESPRGIADAAETLQRLLTVLDFKTPTFTVTETDLPLGQSEVVDGDPDNYSPISPKNHQFSTLELQLPPAPKESFPASWVPSILKNQRKIPMQQLINDYWKPEELSDIKYAVNGKIHFYKTGERKKNPLGDGSVAPDILRITVKQPTSYHKKAILTVAKNIQPFGKNGPTYKLKAMIQHFTSHYVAHVVQEDGRVVEADDARVHMNKDGSDIAGFVYYYERVLDSNDIINMD